MKKLFFIFACFLFTKANAKHIVGGEMIYDDLGGGKYRITLKVYRDCFGGGPDFDQPTEFAKAWITVYTGSDSLVGVFDIGAPVITSVPPAFNNPCVLTPNTVCIEQGVYTYTLNLPPKNGGYYITYQRCCRNNTIINIVTPGLVGSTYYARMPGPEVAAVNNSPRFKKLPPIYVCNSLDFTFDHSAVDPDGDQLVYSLCAPFQGLDGCCAFINYGPPPQANPGCPSPPASCPNLAAPAPYTPVIFSAPYSSSYPIASNPAFSINPTTGILAGKPTMNGQWVFCICVHEFRNNQLIGTHYRDFQITVFNCIVTTIASVPEDGFNKCRGLTVTFGNNSTTSSPIPLTYSWDFGVLNITSDTSHLATPTYAYPDTGKYVITLVVNPGKPCTDTVKKTVFVYEKYEVSFPKNAKQCFKNNSFNFIAMGENLSPSTFTWNFTPVATPSISNLQNPTNINFSQAGNYVVRLIAQQRTCLDTVIDTVIIFYPPKAKINNLPTTLCDPANVAFSNGSSGDFPMNYFWKFSNGNNSTDYEPTQVFTPPGVYGVTLTATTYSVCIDTSIVSVSNITVNPSPHAGFTFSPQTTTIFDPEITINNAASFDVVYWYYLFGDGGSSNYSQDKHVYQEYGDYPLEQTVYNTYGCSDKLTQTVRILPEYRFWIPNAFTPDENLLNDYFMPIAIGVVNYEFEIFDRWGERIFKTNNPKQGWNGFFQGKECKQDIYVWRITFKNVVTEKDEVHYGHVTLLKNL